PGLPVKIDSVSIEAKEESPVLKYRVTISGEATGILSLNLRRSTRCSISRSKERFQTDGSYRSGTGSSKAVKYLFFLLVSQLEMNISRDLAFSELKKCGKAALPVLRRMLSDETILKAHSEVIKSLAAAGGCKVL